MINNDTLEEIFERLMNRFENENQSESNINHGSKLSFSDEEIIFMARYNLDAFSNKYPGISTYYIECLS